MSTPDASALPADVTTNADPIAGRGQMNDRADHAGRTRTPAGAQLAVGIAAFVIVLARQPHNIFRPQFVFEELPAFWVPAYLLGPLEYLAEPWAGYLQVPARASFLLARLVPAVHAPLVTIVIAALAIALVAAFFASDRLAVAIPDWRVRVGFALAIPMLPLFGAFFGVLNSQWFFALYLVGLSLTVERRWWDYGGAAIAGFSGIGALVALPLFWRDRRGLVLLVAAAIQVVFLLDSERKPGALGVSAVAVIGLLALGGLALIPSLPLRTRVSFTYLGAATVLLGSWAMGPMLIHSRFMLALVAAITLMVIAGIVARRWLVLLPAGVLLALGLAFLPIPSLGDADWPAHADCIGGPDPCHVPVGTGDEWSLDWPGEGQPFVHHDPRLYRSPDWGR